MSLPPAWKKPSTDVSQLPPEVLLYIFCKVESSKDLHNLCLASPKFNQLLHCHKKSWEFELVLPHLLPYLDRRSVLNSRLICCEWQDAIDEFIREPPNNRPFEAPLPYWLQRLTWPFILTSTLQARRFTEKVTAFPECRLVGGKIRVGYDGRDLPADYWNAIWPLLKGRGAEISLLEIIPEDETDLDRSTNSLYFYLQMILTLCPNLNNLQVMSTSDDRQSEAEEMSLGSLMLEQRPMPNISSLKSIEVSERVWNNVSNFLLETYGHQLTRLQLTRWVPDQTLQRLNLLTELTFQITVPRGERLDLEVDARRLMRLIPSRHLQKLRFKTSLTDDWFLSVTVILDLCATFSLKTLQFCGGCRVHLDGSEGAPPSRRIRSLEHFEFPDAVGVQTFNFLSCFPCLQSVHFHGTYLTPIQIGFTYPHPPTGITQSAPQTVEIRPFLYQTDGAMMHKSNVWRILKDLKEISFEYSVGYEGRSTTVVVERESRQVFSRAEYGKT